MSVWRLSHRADRDALPLADRIRASEDYYEVLKDYGFKVDKAKGKR